jgi:hypothetical protein
MSFRHELLVQAVASAEDGPRAGTARIVLPQVLQLLWDCNVAVEFDPPGHVLAWITRDEDTQVFLVRVRVSDLPAAGSTDAPGGQLALAAAAILWTLLHRDIPPEEAERKPDPKEAARRLVLRDAAAQRVRKAYATLAKQVADGK